MNENELKKLVLVFAKYNIKIKHSDLMITQINEQPATLDAGTYMPDQMVELICKFMKTQIIKDIWNL
ncbi:hypothetical protein [Apilactobacillus timberlakei]|uniref:Uncharacterized protein n=2 Tax=Apilactobacillus timberlakei TaxID=2008380 RepID=A0ABY2YUG8_9LACO|nr:hypothetical protein [Apilactobacillus timberlakei]TPR14712.1 hypothetical protein DYZ97_00845 [Apilactobacillus timberlakei]TPR15679.1 hypothetical protein DY052_03630 [Apilactobacillus timberlakei]TPR16040.1 hypothetical protein DY048_00845 [Apilactobacillus timberlakei]TPR18272.1 hypothetical protein DYZ95_02935 [Apilactobacillus timberlakei]TPR18781.1 hypothetical protein DY138_03970 [Apilactobacillus timberlakei]